MKPRFSPRFAAFALLAPIFCSFSAHATDGTWNGSAGTWDISATNWTGVAGNPWDATSGPNNKAIFGSSAGNVTLSGTVYAGALEFNTNTRSISGGTLTLGDNSTGSFAPTITTTTDATITSAITGNDGLTKEGAGTLTLGANSYSGLTTINAGTLQLNSGTNANTSYTINSLGTLKLASATGLDWSKYTGSGTLALAVNSTWGDSIALTTGFTGTLKVEGGRALIVGNTTANYGLGNTSTIVVTQGGQMGFNLVTTPTLGQNFVISGTGRNEAGFESALRMHNATLSGSVTLAGATTLGSVATATISGVISESTIGSALTLGTSGQVGGIVMSGSTSNTFTGATTLRYGRLELSKTGGAVAIQGDMILGSASGRVTVGMNQDNQFGLNSVVRFSGGQTAGLELNGTTQTVAGLDSTGYTGGAAIIQHRENTSLAAVDATSHLIIDVAAGNSFTFGHGTLSLIRDYNGGTMSLTKKGAGTQILKTNGSGAANTIYTGNTSVEGGTLQFGLVKSLYASTSGAVSGTNAQKLTVSSGATAAFNVGDNAADTIYFKSTDINTLLTSSTGGKGFLAGSNLGLDTTNATGGKFTHSSAIANTSNGVLGLTKLGSGTLELTSANSYAGATTIKAGTLELSGSGSIASSSIVVGDAGSSGAVLDVATISGAAFTVGASQTVSGIGAVNAGAKTVTVGGALAPGNSAGTLSISTTAAVGLQFLNNGSLNIELTRGLAPAAGTNYDQLGLNGTLSIDSGADLNLSALGTGTYALNSIYFLISNDGSDAITGEFQGFTEGGQITFDGQLFNVTYDANYTGVGPNGGTFNNGNDFALMAVPEPNVAALLGGMGMLALLRRRR